ncbi:MAG: ABC transporter ATP-binding protein [Alphaproteobacteria bacterium]|nr:MAG: ABC transporter ATP-binding protein [Alphaproteobacteria bacterium]
MGQNPLLESTQHLARIRDFAAVIVASRWSIGILLVTLAGHAALEPSSAWITKTVLDAVKNTGATIEQVILRHGLLFVAIMGGLTLLKFGEKIANKAVEIRLIITLQRVYLERRTEEHTANDVSQILYGCELAKKGIEVVYKDAWKIIVTTVSVLAWQVNLGAQWIPLMLMSLVPSLLLVWFFGPPIQRMSHGILDLQARLAASTGRAANGTFTRHQEHWFRKALWLEVLKWFADDALDILMWVFLALLVLIAYVFGLGILPADIELGGAAAFLINVKLLAKPLGDIGKVYTKWREAYPAATRVFAPGSPQPD